MIFAIEYIDTLPPQCQQLFVHVGNRARFPSFVDAIWAQFPVFVGRIIM